MTKNPQFHGGANISLLSTTLLEMKQRKKQWYCRTDDMIADMLTKGLHAERFVKLREMAGLRELKQVKQQYDTYMSASDVWKIQHETPPRVLYSSVHHESAVL